VFERPERINQNQFIERIEPNILQNIINNKISLNIELQNEGDISKKSINLIEKQLKELNIQYDNVTFTHSCYQFPETKIKTIFIDKHFNLKASQAYKFNKSNKLFQETGNDKSYKFHIPNRRLKKHRLQLLEKLYEYDENFINNNLVSFDIDLEWNRESIETTLADNPFKIFLYDNKIKKIDESDMVRLDGYNSEFIDVYKNSYITIVTETFFDDDFYYISEKTFKPLMQQHPFILMGRPNSLKYLKDIGFKTFHPFINETYDEIENNNDRFNTILNEIKRLNELSNEDLHLLVQNLNNILQFNQNHLIQFGEDMFKSKFI
jgi:hypothetical protein